MWGYNCIATSRLGFYPVFHSLRGTWVWRLHRPSGDMTARGPDTLREPEQSAVAPTSGQAPRLLKRCPASAGRMGVSLPDGRCQTSHRIRGAHGWLMAPRLPRTYGAPWVGCPFPGVTHTYGVLTPGYFHPTATRSFKHPRGGWAFRPSRARAHGRFAIPAAKRRCNNSPTSSEARAMVWGMWG